MNTFSVNDWPKTKMAYLAVSQIIYRVHTQHRLTSKASHDGDEYAFLFSRRKDKRRYVTTKNGFKPFLPFFAGITVVDVSAKFRFPLSSRLSPTGIGLYESVARQLLIIK